VLSQVRERHPEQALIALLYRSGLRVSEIVALRPAYVDLKKHSVRDSTGKENPQIATILTIWGSAGSCGRHWRCRISGDVHRSADSEEPPGLIALAPTAAHVRDDLAVVAD
jgi:hypothetical protein